MGEKQGHTPAKFRGAVKSGSAFEWTGKGSWFRLPFLAASSSNRNDQ